MGKKPQVAPYRCHVGDGGAVGQGQVGQAVAEEFHELAHHTPATQHFGDGQHQVGGGDAFTQLAADLEADDLGNQHGDRLAKHGRFRFDTAHAPAQYPKAVDHGGVGIGAHQGVRVGVGVAVLGFGRPHTLGQVFQVHLVADTGARWHHAEVVEGFLAPAQELVTLPVALVLDFHVLFEGLRVAELVHHHRVVDDQIHRCQRINAARIPRPS